MKSQCLNDKKPDSWAARLLGSKKSCKQMTNVKAQMGESLPTAHRASASRV
jgi:hypothetical protein